MGRKGAGAPYIAPVILRHDRLAVVATYCQQLYIQQEINELVHLESAIIQESEVK